MAQDVTFLTRALTLEINQATWLWVTGGSVCERICWAGLQYRVFFPSSWLCSSVDHHLQTETFRQPRCWKFPCSLPKLDAYQWDTSNASLIFLFPSKRNKGNQSQVHQLGFLCKNKSMTLNKIFSPIPLFTLAIWSRAHRNLWKLLTQTSKGSTISPCSSVPFKHSQHFMQHSVFNKSGAIHRQMAKHFSVINNTPQQKQILFNGWFYGSWKWI